MRFSRPRGCCLIRRALTWLLWALIAPCVGTWRSWCQGQRRTQGWGLAALPPLPRAENVNKYFKGRRAAFSSCGPRTGNCARGFLDASTVARPAFDPTGRRREISDGAGKAGQSSARPCGPCGTVRGGPFQPGVQRYRRIAGTWLYWLSARHGYKGTASGIPIHAQRSRLIPYPLLHHTPAAGRARSGCGRPEATGQSC
jgi:hypothetical protein